jgi:hypothetical protein
LVHHQVQARTIRVKNRRPLRFVQRIDRTTYGGGHFAGGLWRFTFGALPR